MNNQENNTRILKLLKEAYNDVIQASHSEFRVCCPKCVDIKGSADTKFHMYVNPYTIKGDKVGTWNCFRCGYKGYGIPILSDTENKLTRLEEVVLSDNRKEQSISINNDLLSGTYTHKNGSKKFQKSFQIHLPEGFSTLFSSSLLGRAAYKYLTTTRGLSDNDISQYKIGFCIKGRLAGHVVIPVYMNNKLVYYVARSIFKKQYINAPVSNKTIIFNMANQKTLIITEGIFDAIRIGTNAVALLGKTIKQEQFNIIKKSKVDKILIFLDKDAKTEALALADRFSTYFDEVYLVKPTTKDPGSMNSVEITTAIESAVKFSAQGKLEYLCM